VPELPDVEDYRSIFSEHAARKKVLDVEADATIVRSASVRSLDAALSGQRFHEPRRHGKWLICPTSGPSLLLHFGMTGGLVWSGEDPDRHRHDRLFLSFNDGELRYRNMRKLGGAWLAHDDDETARVLGPIGPDAYEVSAEQFLRILDKRRGGIKAALMDQHLIAGLGNLTTDEALWHARIAPKRAIASIDKRERRALYRKIRKVLRDSIEVGRVPSKRSWLTSERGERDARCPRCKSALDRATVAGRTTYWCPECQPDG
jgi:formamidopyrimidine-DNA glycosylase